MVRIISNSVVVRGVAYEKSLAHRQRELSHREEHANDAVRGLANVVETKCTLWG